jgi:hypothetical protein
LKNYAIFIALQGRISGTRHEIICLFRDFLTQVPIRDANLQGNETKENTLSSRARNIRKAFGKQTGNNH